MQAVLRGGKGCLCEKRIVTQELKARTGLLGFEDPSTLTSAEILSLILKDMGKYELAEAMHRQTLAAIEKVLGPGYPSSLLSMDNLAQVWVGEASTRRQSRSIGRRWRQARRCLGVSILYTLVSVYCLAYFLGGQHRFNEAALLYQRACQGYSLVLGDDHPTMQACRRHYLENASLEAMARKTSNILNHTATD